MVDRIVGKVDCARGLEGWPEKEFFVKRDA
jgi:hypothetical protein